MAYGWAEHVGELELWIEAPTREAVLADGLRALGALLADDEDAVADAQTEAHEIALEGDDLPVLLADWLAELAFLAETEGFVPEAVDELVLSADGLRARVRGRRAAPPHLVKAVTYHRLAFAPHEGGWRATALLDV
jgi:SHS2 domain-containing protein